MGIYTLSNELKDLIFIRFLQLHLEPGRLREVATVSRPFYAFLRPYFWHTIVLKRLRNSPNDPSCAAVAALFADTTREPVNIKVKVLRIDDSLVDDFPPGPFPMTVALDPHLPSLLWQLPSLVKLSLIDIDWSHPQSPVSIEYLSICLRQPSLKSVTINSSLYPVDLIDYCHSVKTLTLSGEPIGASQDGAARRPKPCHLRLAMSTEHFGIVWSRIDTEELQTLIIPYEAGMENEIEDTFPFYGSKLKSLSITWFTNGPYSDDEDEEQGDFWPDFESLPELRELNISYPAWQSDWAQRLADFLDLFDPKMAKLEYLNIYLLVDFADSLHYEEIEGLSEFDSQLAHFQLATLKKVIFALCPIDPDGTAARDYEGPEGEDESDDDGEGDDGDYGDYGDEGEAETGEEESEEEVEEVEVNAARSAETKSLAALAASSLGMIRRALPATRARAPDLLSVELSEVRVPWEDVFDE